MRCGTQSASAPSRWGTRAIHAAIEWCSSWSHVEAACKISTASIQVVTDLSVLRELAEGLLRYDAVTFLQLLDTLRLSEGRAAVWLLHSAAHTIFDYVRNTVT